MSAMQFLLVVHSEAAIVMADDAAVGVTNHMLMLPSGEYRITLSPIGHEPRHVVLTGTSLVRPMCVVFASRTASPEP